MPFKVYPPRALRPIGRPRKARIRAPHGRNKIIIKYKCGRCGGLGHHQNKCKAKLDDTIVASSNTSNKGKGGRPRKGSNIPSSTTTRTVRSTDD